MTVIQNVAISEPKIEYVVAFVAFGTLHRSAMRRSVRVRAASPTHAKRICKLRYPRSGSLGIVSASDMIDTDSASGSDS